MSAPASLLDAIAAEVRTCTLCRLHAGRTRAVPGAGSPDAEIMFIGEGPGFNEDKQGLPFVGRSGDLLVTLLREIGLTRDAVFIGNVVKCRPPENRDPLPDEMAACAPYLNRQEAALDPLVIVTLGRFSMGRYFPKASISRIHGQPRIEARRALLPLYHPAAVLRNPALMPEMQADFARIPLLVEQVRALRAAAQPPVTPPVSDEDDAHPPQQLSLF
jgi:DNA polymerase